MSLKFIPASSSKDLAKIFNYNLEAFSETADVKWSLEALKKEVSQGWKIYSVIEGESKEIMAVLFTKEENGTLYTKNTSLKLDFQGQGNSHRIKEFYEKLANDQGLNEVVSLCRKDNFRMISLNETHGYKLVSEISDGEGGVLLEWRKRLSSKS